MLRLKQQKQHFLIWNANTMFEIRNLHYLEQTFDIPYTKYQIYTLN